MFVDLIVGNVRIDKTSVMKKVVLELELEEKVLIQSIVRIEVTEDEAKEITDRYIQGKSTIDTNKYCVAYEREYRFGTGPIINRLKEKNNNG